MNGLHSPGHLEECMTGGLQRQGGQGGRGQRGGGQGGRGRGQGQRQGQGQGQGQGHGHGQGQGQGQGQDQGKGQGQGKGIKQKLLKSYHTNCGRVGEQVDAVLFSDWSYLQAISH